MEHFRSLPSVDSLLLEQSIKELEDVYAHSMLVDLVRQCLKEVRSSIKGGQPPPPFKDIVQTICNRAQSMLLPSPRSVINATGVIIHTNLGRAPLSREAIEAIEQISRGYSNLEFDLNTGKRGSRHSHVERLLCQVTGAESALVVNNNASAVLLTLSALARRKEVIVSRGQAVEIGGEFRIPDVMRQSGAKLVEVGTTNRSYVVDYEQAITPRTAALLQVHSSNFKMLGFTHAASLEELIQLGEKNGLIVLDDLGSGCLLDTTKFGLNPEPTVQDSIHLNIDLAMFSGDKLLGGPQAGIVVGKKQLVDKLKKHPLARAVRIDKLSLAGLAATLVHYLKGEALSKVPVWRMISASQEQVGERARQWVQALGDIAELVTGESMVGGGSLPGSTLPTTLVAITSVGQGKRRNSAKELAQRLRLQDPLIVGRIHEDRLFLDPRTVLPEEDEAVIRALRNM
ncbi:L-seryl-tRNA(Sec) selenium transferase [Chloroflexota bacterium]